MTEDSDDSSIQVVDPSDVLQKGKNELRPSTTLINQNHTKMKSAYHKNERTPTRVQKVTSDAKSEFATRNHLKKIQKFDLKQKPDDDPI